MWYNGGISHHGTTMFVGFMILVLHVLAGTVDGSSTNCPYDGDLTASTDFYSITIFNQSLSSSTYTGQMECIWTIEAESLHVRLNFSSFHILRDDCIKIYDGPSSSYSKRLDSICDSFTSPTSPYNSSGSHLTVLFSQGRVSGQRWFTMNYTAFDTSSEDSSFWETTVGRVFSFGIFIFIFAVVSMLFKDCTRSNSSRKCECLREFFCGCLRMCGSGCERIRGCLGGRGSSMRQQSEGSGSRTRVVSSHSASEATGSQHSSAWERTDVEDEDGNLPWTVGISTVEGGAVTDPQLPPSYSSAVAYPPTPSVPPGQHGTLSPPPSYNDSTRDAPPPPSYESLFDKDNSQA